MAEMGAKLTPGGEFEPNTPSSHVHDLCFESRIKGNVEFILPGTRVGSDQQPEKFMAGWRMWFKPLK
jgi:hypothetical protein